MPNRLIRMSGRNPGETHRSATPLELLFDLAFVVAFGQAADQLAHAIAEDHLAVGLGGFAFAMFAICWAWINFSWFASAFDTDDWFYRITTFVQMIGVGEATGAMDQMLNKIADFYDDPALYARRSEDEITIAKNGGGAHLDLMTATYIARAWANRSA